MNFNEHFERIRLGANNVYGLNNLTDWIEKYTFLEDKPFSFEGHEYQRDILLDESPNVYCSKAAQTGLTEVWSRWIVAASCTQRNFTIIWTFPSSSDAERFTKARLDPMIAASEEAKRMISKIVDSVELKQFGKNNFVYVRGTISETGALSVPADVLVHDEYDRSDMNNISAYVSRLQHKATKKRKIFSTPTVAKYGISALAETSRRKRQMWKCSHCNHHFLPDYEQDVHIPGYDGDKKHINKAMLKDLAWREAKLMCPKCFKVPDHSLKFREWVIENSAEQYDDVTYFVSPFCAPAHLTPSYLVKASTDFEKWSEFCNQALGITAEDVKETLTGTDVRNAIVKFPLDSSEVHYMGVDMGLMCYFTIGRLATTGEFMIVKREAVPLSKFEERRQELIRQYRCMVSVHDAYPYTNTISKICEYDPNAWAAIYVQKKSLEAFYTKTQEEDDETGKLFLQGVYVNREVALDEVMDLFKKKKIIIAHSEQDEEYIAHLTSMKRVQVFDKSGGIVYKWQKTDGIDHFHHSTLYCYVASKLRGTVTPEQLTGVSDLVTILQVKKKR